MRRRCSGVRRVRLNARATPPQKQQGLKNLGHAEWPRVSLPKSRASQPNWQASRERIANLEAAIDIDPLTETLNRRGFERELKRSLAYVKRYGATAALIYLDLDDFKPVNDRHGHAAGDAVLKAIAAALCSRVRASDVVARIGGDEFAVLLWNISAADARAKAAALEAAAYATPVVWGRSTLAVGASAGVTVCGPTDSAAEVLARADAEMYARKAERQRVVTR